MFVNKRGSRENAPLDQPVSAILPHSTWDPELKTALQDSHLSYRSRASMSRQQDSPSSALPKCLTQE